MSRRQQSPGELRRRVEAAAEAALAEQDYVSAVDVLLHLGWLPPTVLQAWRRGQSERLESVIQVRPERLSDALSMIRQWAGERGLVASEAEYVAKTAAREPLRFSLDADEAREREYRTHWLSPKLSPKAQQRVAEKASRAPELVVISPLNHDWACQACGGSEGGLMIMEGPGPKCLKCAGLDDLEYLPAGDAGLTRRAKAASARHAVVVRFSRARNHYERQGMLVEPKALAEAQR